MPTEENQARRKRILVVDDESRVCEFLKYRLREHYDIQTASSGEEGLEIVHRYKPDVVVLDFLMPVMDGYEVLKRIKEDKDEDVRGTRVIIITGYGTIDNAVACMKAGAEDFITKPFELSRLTNSIDVALKN